MTPFGRLKTHRGFVAGLFCGGILTGIAWGASVWWNPRHHASLPSVNELFPARATRDYDNCLVTQRGSTEVCDALMRMRDADKRLKRNDTVVRIPPEKIGWTI
jgi:hypothetical protein